MLSSELTTTPLKPLEQDLRQAVAPFYGLNRVAAIARFLSLGIICLGSAAIAWQFPLGWAFAFWTAVGAIAYGFWLVCTHDAVHQTLTGHKRLDLWLARLISWPIWWPVGVYSELHWLHHRWNGTDLRDPERTQWTQAEYEAASTLVRWYVRHQWVWNILVAGSFGLIFNAFRCGWHCRRELTSQRVRYRPHLIAQMRLDVLGMVLLHSGLFFWVAQNSAWLQYLVFWLIVEWIVGVMMQTRAHLEHYGCWQQRKSNLLTQLYATRNVNGAVWVNVLMGGLPYHAIHHAFPAIPFHNLPQAYEAVQAVLEKCDQERLAIAPGYWQSTFTEGSRYLLIESEMQRIHESIQHDGSVV